MYRNPVHSKAQNRKKNKKNMKIRSDWTGHTPIAGDKWGFLILHHRLRSGESRSVAICVLPCHIHHGFTVDKESRRRGSESSSHRREKEEGDDPHDPPNGAKRAPRSRCRGRGRRGIASPERQVPNERGPHGGEHDDHVELHKVHDARVCRCRRGRRDAQARCGGEECVEVPCEAEELVHEH